MTSAAGGNQISSGASRCVVALSGDQRREELMDALLVDPRIPGVVFVDSIARGYSRVKQVAPDLVVVLAGTDDVPACQLLSMLKMDSDTSGIPVFTWISGRQETELEDFVAERMIASRSLWT